jgi:hypothetical protein
MQRGLILTACFSLFAGCSSDDSDSGNAAATQVCYDLCAAQDEAETEGNCPGIGLETCRLFCKQLQGNRCASELDELSTCQLTGEFHCGIFSAESDADCASEENAYQACAGSASCAGADEDGFCPSVECACPDETTSISAIISDGEQCTCADSTTCREFCF